MKLVGRYKPQFRLTFTLSSARSSCKHLYLSLLTHTHQLSQQIMELQEAHTVHNGLQMGGLTRQNFHTDVKTIFKTWKHVLSSSFSPLSLFLSLPLSPSLSPLSSSLSPLSSSFSLLDLFKISYQQPLMQMLKTVPCLSGTDCPPVQTT